MTMLVENMTASQNGYVDLDFGPQAQLKRQWEEQKLKLTEKIVTKSNHSVKPVLNKMQGQD